MKHVAIVGASLAGLSAARALRNQGFDGQLTVVGDEVRRPYDRPPLSKEFLAGRISEQDLALEADDDDLGAEWRLGTAATRLDTASGAIELDDESRIEADGVVLAVPPAVAARLAPAGTVSTGTVGEAAAAGNGHGLLGQPGPEQWRELATSPIVNVHVIYDRRVTRLPFAAAVDSPVQWVFDRTGPSGLRSGQYLAVSLSAADGYVDVPASALRERFLPAMADLFPAARDARVTDFFVTRERRATLRQVPGCERLRPGAATALPGLVLAGAWTDTGWPDTMEGAVRSGRAAARLLLDRVPSTA